MAAPGSNLKNKNEVCVGPTSLNAGKASSCAGCPNQAECSSGKFAAQKLQQQKENEQIVASLESVKNILLVLSGKGGVGKSTVASQIAWSLAHWGLKVGILDIDICGPSIARMMGVEKENVRPTSTGWVPVYTTNGYDDDDNDDDESDEVSLSVMSVAFLLQSRNDAIIWRGPRKNGLIKQFLCDVNWDELDFLIIDSPPGTSDEHISIQKFLSTIIQRQQNNNENNENSENTSTAAGGGTQVHSIIVSTPQEVSLLDVRKEISFCKKVKLPILGIIENMSYFVCPCCNKKSEIFLATTGGVPKMCKDLKENFLGALPIDPLFLKCCDQGIGYLKYWEDNGDKHMNKQNGHNSNSNHNNNNNNDNNNNNGDSKMDDNENVKMNANESTTYSSLINVIDTIMKGISPETQKYVKKMRNERIALRQKRLKEKKNKKKNNNDTQMVHK